MPELRLVVLALQDRLAYGPTFESALAALFGGAVSLMSAAAVTAEPVRDAPASAASPQPAADLNAIYLQAERHCWKVVGWHVRRGALLVIPSGRALRMLRTPAAPETRSFADCYRHPIPRQASPWVEMSYR